MYHGDIALGSTINVKFTTRQISGAPTTLAGSPTVAAYIGSSTTEITAGITLTVDFDSRTGLNNVTVVATSGNGFATASDVELVITAGTVNSVSVVGEVIGSFSIENRSALRPATAGRTAVVDAAGLIDANMVKAGPTGSGTAQTARDLGASVLLSPGTGTGQVNLSSGKVPATLAATDVTGNVAADLQTIKTQAVTCAAGVTILASVGTATANTAQTGDVFGLFVIHSGTAQAGAATTITLASGASATNNLYDGEIVEIVSGTGAGQVNTIVSYVGSTKVATVAQTWATNPANDSVYRLLPAPGGTSPPSAAAICAALAAYPLAGREQTGIALASATVADAWYSAWAYATGPQTAGGTAGLSKDNTGNIMRTWTYTTTVTTQARA